MNRFLRAMLSPCNSIARALALAAVLVLAPPAAAQFAAQQTYVATSAGTANAITLTLPNVSALADLVGVPIRVKMGTTNDAAATLQVNSLAATAINKPTTAGLAALSGGEIVSGQASVFMYNGTIFELLSPNLFLGTVPAQTGFEVPTNLQINCTASANALTCALKAANTGGNPSALAPIYVPFRDTTTALGDPVWRTITAAVTFTVSGGNTMGCASGAPCRLWITLIDNGGTILLGLSNQQSATAIFPLNEGVLQTTGAGTGGGSTAGTIFTSVAAVSTKAVRIIGYVEWTTLATAGNWTTPNFVQLFGPGVPRPGAVVQTVLNLTTTQGSTASGTFANLASGQSLAITPTSAANFVRVSFFGTIGNASSSANNLRVVRTVSAVTTAIGAPIYANVVTGSSGYPISDVIYDLPAATSAATYNFQGVTGAGTLLYPFSGGASNGSTLILEEIMGALGDNDNAPPLGMVG